MSIQMATPAAGIWRRSPEAGIHTGEGVFSPERVSGLQLWLDADRQGDVLTDGAAQFTGANSESLSVADNASLSTGNIDFSWAGWVYLDSTTGSPNFAAKWDSGGTDREYLIGFNILTTNRIEFIVRYADDSNQRTIAATSLGLPTTGTWYFVVCWHDAAADTLNIQVNNGTVDSVAHTQGVRDSGRAYTLGAYSGGGSGFFSGRMDSVGFWKKVLSAAERTQLYASAAGLTYADLDAGLKTNLISWWDLDERSGTRNDSHGTNHLTDNNTVTDADGLPSGNATDGDPVGRWKDRTANANHTDQATAAKKPTYKTNILNGHSVVRFDGVDDLLVKASPAGLNSSEGTVFAVYKRSAGTGSQDVLASADEASTRYVVCRGSAATSLKPSILQANNDAGDEVAATTATGTTNFQIVTFKSTGTAYEMYFNGASESLSVVSGANTGDWFADTTGRDNVSIGATKLSSESNFLSGDIAEIAVYDRALSEAERKNVERYLGTKYGITVA